jgi:hypothetical protein
MFISNTNIQSSQKPPAPPPPAVPQYSPFPNDFGSDLIKQYFYYFVYVWMMHGNSFWIYPVDVIGDVLFCYAWDGLDWKYIRLKISQIDCLY